jgi:hypothetical protein
VGLGLRVGVFGFVGASVRYVGSSVGLAVGVPVGFLDGAYTGEGVLVGESVS